MSFTVSIATNPFLAVNPKFDAPLETKEAGVLTRFNSVF